ncbi:MAG: hypothetical protein ACRCXX_12640, partial [Cetobacterium sp.]|uniref:hypothetical protein n=1 Tax=Cetobacterium sp. TaxID=2071632 RepID=UPI003F33AC5C
MTLKEWIDNPNLKAIPGYHLVRDQLLTRYKGMVKAGKKFKIAVYQHPANGLLVLVRVPTEGDTPDLTYDVLFHVTGGVQGSVLNNDIKVFSNCPSFTYRFAYVCGKLG